MSWPDRSDSAAGMVDNVAHSPLTRVRARRTHAEHRSSVAEILDEEGQMENDVVQSSGSALSRRQFLAWTSKGIAVGAVGLPLLLEACAPAAPTGGAAPPAP